ncbi:hypothetical protein FOQG_09501 [Fusarium oxysporum f. sp. raphani 54005]|uniref:Uncharacterized protein n=15 Tax=Fusarium TaxID=5506 RepID=W9IJG6_FUSOX|nr:hypothetical protein FOXG_00691 [Fusarium oxysporum f. sp. lycopersici 4287]XP_018232913.1 hypothetical protein FOXG_00691 [Fusarium oxysporum f. sp. lycopersici 4287]XP_018743199.1 hypothetical protein FVEG_00820 [Fusarium verticillioides 7600]XP_041676558.1 uncharacterized protein FMAN_01221 [Fusarium mangiferae]XP_054558740.1 uncharacterized protein FOBCDRAFT_3168 [Fusarium oxysporum Fo47]EWY93419.1 hypothetical protein FOYG_06632 [Fusarium oxysporum NRRL 32931]EWZ91251.1 hypothetical p
MLSFVNYTPRPHPEHKNKEHCRVHSNPSNIPRDISNNTPATDPKSAIPRSAAPPAPAA